MFQKAPKFHAYIDFI